MCSLTAERVLLDEMYPALSNCLDMMYPAFSDCLDEMTQAHILKNARYSPSLHVHGRALTFQNVWQHDWASLQVNATCNVEGGYFNDWFTGA
jgi:hypothetical protein